jgi:hypothetical protein
MDSLIAHPEPHEMLAEYCESFSTASDLPIPNWPGIRTGVTCPETDGIHG